MADLHIFDETGHVLRYGQRVPRNAINLAFIHYPEISPSDAVVVVDASTDVDDNDDDAALGCKRIRVDGVVADAANRWTVQLSAGSFYQEEDVESEEEYTASVPLWVSGSFSLPDPWVDMTLRWEFCTGRFQAIADDATEALDSDPLQFRTDVADPYDRLVYRVPGTPLIVDASYPPVLYATDDGITTAGLSEITCTIVDKDAGLIRAAQSISANKIPVIRYLSRRTTIPFYGYHDGTDGYTLDLNPLPGHFSFFTATSNKNVVSAADESVVDSVGNTVIATGGFEVSVQESRQLIEVGGVYLYLEPFRCTILNSSTGAVLDTIHNDDGTNVRWCSADMLEDFVANRPDMRLVARLYPRSPVSIQQVRVYDTRRRGGGIVESVTVETFSDLLNYFDATNLDGLPSMENGVVVVQLPAAIIDKYGDQAIRTAIERTLAAGINYIVERIEE